MDVQSDALVNPLLILALSVGVVVLAVGVLRLHPFFSLLLSAAVVAVLSAKGSDSLRFVKAIDGVMAEAGVVMGRLGFTIAMAAVIGMCLLESGAADRIIRRLIAVFGERRASVALLLGAFVIAGPVFVDTVMMLLLPLARALSLRTGRHYLLNVLVVCAGASLANGVIPPAPGPLFVAEALRLPLGIAMIAGVVFCIIPLAAALVTARWFDGRITVPVRPVPGSTLDSLRLIAARPESELPPLWLSVCPVLVPLLLISIASFAALAHKTWSPVIETAMETLGNKNVALAIGGVIAVIMYARQKDVTGRDAARILGRPLETAGVIILIVSAGGAYGAMIKNAGVGDAVKALATGHSINYVVLAWLLAALIRAAQGSATVATIAASGIMLSIAGADGFGVHPLYIFLAIGFGAKFLAWMNDAGFWVVCRMGGLTQEETLRSWTPTVSIVSIVGLIEVWVVSSLWPRLPL